jgi:ubiquitin-small subunit ribosomal protein S27Ae
MAGPKKNDKKAPAKKEKKPRNLHTLYNISGEGIEKKNRSCPKCGPGTFLGKHENRLVCGSCQYVEFVNKEEPKEDTQKPKIPDTAENGKKE